MQDIEQSLRALATARDLGAAATQLLNTLGYASDNTVEIAPATFQGFEKTFGVELNAERARAADWKSVHALFQFNADNLGAQKNFGAEFKGDLFDSFLFFAVDLKGDDYARGALAGIVRELNKKFAAPVVALLRHGGKLTLATTARRGRKDRQAGHVLEAVTLLKDIRLHKPHRAHIEILAGLQNAKLAASDWSGFLKEWNRVLDVSELNKRFYSDYRVVFETFEALVPIENQESCRLWTQRLFNRLIFLRFVEKKGFILKDIVFCHIRNRYIKYAWTVLLGIALIVFGTR